MYSKDIYRTRFEGENLIIKNKVWKTLCQKFFQNFINKEDTILDLGAGYCEFINNIKAGKKYAIDINSDVEKYAADDVIVEVSDIKKTNIKSDSIDKVFISNVFEHLNTKEDIIAVLEEINRILKKNGHLLILQPNIKYCYKEYWDYLDHKLPLTDKSLVEALVITKFKIKKVIPKFIPYTIKNSLPKNPFIIKIYLSFPVFWKLFGKQAFIIAEKLMD